jgi:NAD(P)-dependent dehydrogenase (short-subunit alcohol dehydrogenase family)
MELMPRTWLITGSNRGLAEALAAAVLSPSDQLVFTARNPGRPRAVALVADRARDRDRDKPQLEERRWLAGAPARAAA